MDDAQLEMLQRWICHKNVVETRDVFRSKETTYAVFEHRLFLCKIASNPIATFKVQLTAVIGYVRVQRAVNLEQSTKENR
jgi:hypothetical protein